jgi:acetylornithine/succinyldiaminopimelate/putrescine aminotransferase
MLPGFVHVPFDDLAAAKRAVTARTCAVLVEPVQGEGGVRLPSEGYLLGLQALCRKHGLLLILDEIQTGLGRTGSLFYYQQVKGLKPDLLTLAKSLGGGLPLSAVLATEKAARLVGPGEHGTTMGGNAVACAAGAALVREVITKKLPQRAARMGRLLKSGLEGLQKDFPVIRQVRVAGLMAGVELSCEAAPLAREALKRGLLVNATAGNVLRLLPPLTLSEGELSRGLGLLKKVFETQL